jgi:hypothetical protein
VEGVSAHPHLTTKKFFGIINIEKQMMKEKSNENFFGIHAGGN